MARWKRPAHRAASRPATLQAVRMLAGPAVPGQAEAAVMATCKQRGDRGRRTAVFPAEPRSGRPALAVRRDEATGGLHRAAVLPGLSARSKTLSTSARLTIPASRPSSSTTGGRLTWRAYISRAASATSAPELVVTIGAVVNSAAVTPVALDRCRRRHASPIVTARMPGRSACAAGWLRTLRRPPSRHPGPGRR